MFADISTLLLKAQKSLTQTVKGVKARQATIPKLVKQHNYHIAVMMKNRRSAPKGSITPSKIEMKGLYGLSVDDPIWRDVAAFDGDPLQVPKWLGDEETQKGIVAMLDAKCCTTELARLKQERSHLQTWYVAQRNALTRAIREAGKYLKPYYWH